MILMGNGLEVVRHGVNSDVQMNSSMSFIDRCLGHAEIVGQPQPEVMMGVSSYYGASCVTVITFRRFCLTFYSP